MASSVMDFIFRDLAISYLKRSDLGQIKPEDLLDNSPQNEVPETKRSGASRHIRSKAASKESASREAGSAPVDNDAAKIAQARIKGYEGDPCPACGSFTLVRNGTCMKCDTCGGTTGCS
jgi:ribonucleoside-diphosphate reductase alpha chain